jgi:hypothetical protein
MQLAEPATGDLLEWVYTRAKLDRPVRIADAQGRRVPGVESRTVPCKDGALTYLYNMNDRSAKARLKPASPAGAIRNLTTAGTMKADEEIELGPYEWVILKLEQ